jgi:3-hydroxyacyl-[acyl-carrier-protein] dehydratase
MRFLLVDRVTSLDSGKRATAVKNVTLSEDFFTHHFPDHPIMPGALIAECLVQLADWLLREQGDFACVALPVSFETVKFHRLVKPGDTLCLDVELVEQVEAEYRFRGHARCNDQVVAAARFTMQLWPAEELQSPEESRRHFRMIRAC